VWTLWIPGVSVVAKRLRYGVGQVVGLAVNNAINRKATGVDSDVDKKAAGKVAATIVVR
jgi:hypothetical protein